MKDGIRLAPDDLAKQNESAEQAYRRVLGFVRKCLYRRGEASPESVAQSILVSITKNHQSLLVLMAEQPDEVLPLILRIATRHINKHNKRTQRHRSTVSLDAGAGESKIKIDPVDDALSPDSEIEFREAENEFQNRFDKFVSELDCELQQLLRLLLTDKYTIDQVASVLGVARRTVARRKGKITEKLVEWLGSLNEDAERNA